MSGDFEWTDDAIATLRKLWAEGHATAEIGRRMGVSRNGVVGKAHRLGLPSRPSPIRPAAEPREPEIPRAPAATLPPLPSVAVSAPVPLVVTVAVPPRPVRFKAPPPPPPPPPVVFKPRAPTRCCWPMGEPGTPQFRFCDAQALSGKPYCADHCTRAFAHHSHPAKELTT